MKAWVLTRQAPIEEQPLQLVETPTPKPAAHEVLVRVDLCGICRTDLHLAEGDLPPGKDQLILGHEIVGRVDAVGDGVTAVQVGEKVGVTWLGRSCGECRHCRAGRENYCAEFRATGRDLDGGFAEYTLAHQDAVFSLETIRLPDDRITPLLCAGVAGYCAYRLMDVSAGYRVGLYGFGPTAYYVLLVAVHHGLEVYVSSRSETHLEQARRHGAVWVGNAARQPVPVELDAAIVFPPAGPLVELALGHIKPGGILVLAPVAMSPIAIRDYSANLWGRDVRTLYNVNRRDAEAFLRLAGEVGPSLGSDVFPFQACQEALIRVRRGETVHAHAAVRL